jgi:hypothetical protein
MFASRSGFMSRMGGYSLDDPAHLPDLHGGLARGRVLAQVTYVLTKQPL